MHYTPRLNTLTERERQILVHVAQGDKNKDIAKNLGLAKKTIDNTMVVIREKLDASNRTHAVVRAMEEGYI